MPLNPTYVERIVEIIAREVLLALADEQQGEPIKGVFCKGECAEGICVKTCFDAVGLVISAGAERITTRLGGIPADLSIASMIDHTLLKPDATPDQIAQLCYEARKYGFASVCVNPTNVRTAAELLRGSPVKVCSVVGFPLGATPPEVKAFEAKTAIEQGANEIDMVINIGALKAGDYKLVARDIRGVVQVCKPAGVLVKVILETALLTDDEKVTASLLAKEAGADFVKTSTGFSTGGATVEDVALMRRVVGPGVGVKAAGGVHTLAEVQSMIKAGATRIGASAGVKIVHGAQEKSQVDKPTANPY